MKIHSSCEIEYFAETHIRKLCVIYIHEYNIYNIYIYISKFYPAPSFRLISFFELRYSP